MVNSFKRETERSCIVAIAEGGMTQGRCKPSGHFTGHGLPSLPVCRSATGVEPFRPIDVNDDHHQGPFRGV